MKDNIKIFYIHQTDSAMMIYSNYKGLSFLCPECKKRLLENLEETNDSIKEPILRMKIRCMQLDKKDYDYGIINLFQLYIAWIKDIWMIIKILSSKKY